MMLRRVERDETDTFALAAAAPALRVGALSKAFRRTRALEAVSFEVPDASMTVLLGPAGAGKTTTLRLIAGLDRPDAGRVAMHGADLAGLEPKDRDIAMIFDNLALYPGKTGLQNIAYPLLRRGTSHADAEERAKGTARKLHISHILHRLPKTMSGGERQRVALARALVRKPKLFLLDEPLSSLDAMLRIELRAELKRLQREMGATFLMATPDFSEALAVADRVIVLRAGRVAQIAHPQMIYDEPADRETARFVGAPEINLVDAAFAPDHGGAIRLLGAAFPVPAHLAGAFAAAQDFEAGIRPEHIGLAELVSAPLRGTVFDIEPLGLKSALTVIVGGVALRLVIGAAAAQRLSLKDPVGLAVDTSRLAAFDKTTGLRIAAKSTDEGAKLG